MTVEGMILWFCSRFNRFGPPTMELSRNMISPFTSNVSNLFGKTTVIVASLVQYGQS